MAQVIMLLFAKHWRSCFYHSIIQSVNHPLIYSFRWEIQTHTRDHGEVKPAEILLCKQIGHVTVNQENVRPALNMSKKSKMLSLSALLKTRWEDFLLKVFRFVIRVKWCNVFVNGEFFNLCSSSVVVLSCKWENLHLWALHHTRSWKNGPSNF